MKILIYINKDKDIRRRRSQIAREVKTSVKEGLVEVIEINNKEESLKNIKSAESVIIFAHGSEDKIYHDLSESYSGNEEILIDQTNANILSNKKVIAFCCYTARKLGEYAISDGKCICYIGFRDAINRYLLITPDETPGEVEYFLNTINNEAFKNILIKAMNDNLTFKEIVKNLRHEIRKSALEKINDCGINGQKFDKKYIPQIMLTVGNTADGIAFFGDGNVTLA